MSKCYSSVLDYRQFYYGFVRGVSTNDVSGWYWRMLVVEMKKVCMHKKRIIYVALACRRVGSKRVKVLSSSKRICYDHSRSCRQEVLLQRTTFVLNAYICCCFSNVSLRASDKGEYIDPCVVLQ